MRYFLFALFLTMAFSCKQSHSKLKSNHEASIIDLPLTKEVFNYIETLEIAGDFDILNDSSFKIYEKHKNFKTILSEVNPNGSFLTFVKPDFYATLGDTFSLRTIGRKIIFKEFFQASDCVFDSNHFKLLDYIDYFSIFSNLECNSKFILDNNKYNGEVNFADDYFKKDFVFFTGEEFVFNYPLNFYDCSFDANVFLNNRYSASNFTNEKVGSNFISPILFKGCSLGKKLDLSGCKISPTGGIIFKNSSLPDTLDINTLKLNGIIDLLEAYPTSSGKRCELNILHTDISLLKLQYQNFHLYFPDSILNNKLSVDLISSSFESLLNNFKKNGYTDSYRQLDIEFKEWQSRNDWTLILSNIWWKFGYEKWRILVWTFVYIFLFTLFNYSRFSKLQKAYPVEKLSEKKIYYSSSQFIRLVKKYLGVLFYTGLIFFRFSIDFKNVNFTSFRYVLLLIFEYIVGLVCTAFLINWILKG